jgi:predicted transglutaminase-like cysteine proteinase
MEIIPENILSKMEPADRAKLPKQIRLTAAECSANNDRKRELTMHAEFARWLTLRKKVISYIQANPTKRSTIQKGHPDFTILYMNRCLMIEFKVPPNRLTPEQIERFSELSAAGNETIVCTSAGDAIQLVIERFNFPPGWNAE